MEQEQKIYVNIDVYNRVHNWKISMTNAKDAIKLIDYLQVELFSKEGSVSSIPHDILFNSHRISFDMPAIYYMRLFVTGYKNEGKMSSNTDDRVELIRKDMIDYVCSKLNLSKKDWGIFHTRIENLRNKIVAHFDANEAKFDNDNRGYGIMNVFMKPQYRVELSGVIILMEEYISRFEVS